MTGFLRVHTKLRRGSRSERQSQLRRLVEIFIEVTVPILAVAIWAVLTTNSESFYFPPPAEILDALTEIWFFERFASDLVPSLMRLGAGYVAAVILGLGAGIPLGLSATARHAASPIVEFLRSIPPPALIPLGIVLIGVGDDMKILLIAFTCMWFVLLNTIDGISGIDPTTNDTSRAYGVTGLEKLTRVTIPAASPQIFAGMRVALSVALIMMVISEMIASTNGIGFFVLQQQRSFAIPEMWSGIIVLGLLGYLLNFLFVLVERRVLAWHRGARESALG